MKKTTNKLRFGFATWTAILSITVALPITALLDGCKSTSTEQTIQTSAVVGQDAIDTSMKVWAQSWAKRFQAASAASDSATLAKLQTEKGTVQEALGSYQAAYRIAITSWVASRDAAASTNAAPTTVALAGFSTAFAMASTNLVTVLQSFH